MRHIILFIICFLSLSISPFVSFAEGPIEKSAVDPYEKINPHSLTPIPEPNILTRKRFWRLINLNEKQNKPLFSSTKGITQLIINGVKAGLLTPYKDEAFLESLTQEEFFENLKLPGGGDLHGLEKDLGFAEDDGWGDKKKAISTGDHAEYFLPSEVSMLEISEDLIFHKVWSERLYDIQSVMLIIPEDKFETGLRREVAIFKYKDLANYFDSIPEEAVWVNNDNNARNLKLTEAFARRLFSSRLVKEENPEDLRLEDIYNETPQAWLAASLQLEERISVEEECFRWEP